MDSMSEKLSDVLWVGAVGTATDGFGERMRRDVERRMRGEKDSVPVWIPDREWEKAYDDFCHQVRFSLFCGVIDGLVLMVLGGG